MPGQLPKAYVAARATANYNLSALGTYMFDGFVTTVGDVVWFAAQTAPSERGFYKIVSGAGGVISGERQSAVDDLVAGPGMRVAVKAGTAYGGHFYTVQGGTIAEVADDGESPFVADAEDYRLPADGDNWTPAVARAQQAIQAGVLRFTRRRSYAFRTQPVFSRPIAIQGVNRSTTQLAFYGTSGFTALYGVTLGGGWSISDVSIDYMGSPTENVDRHGVDCSAAGTLERVLIRNWPGDGVRVVADVHATPPTNGNGTRLRDVEVSSVGLNGFDFQGGDANACDIRAPMARGCGQRHVADMGWGFRDESLIGNFVWAGQATTNWSGNVKASKASQFGTHVWYSEAGPNGGQDDVRGPNVAVGGSLSAQTGAPPIAGIHTGVDGSLLIGDQTSAPGGTKAVVVRRGRQASNRIEEWRSSDDVSGTILEAGTAGAYVKTWIRDIAGSGALVSEAWTVDGHPRGRGLKWYPRGVLLGPSQVRVVHDALANKPTVSDGTWRVGDEWWNAKPTSGTPSFVYISAIGAAPGLAITWANGPLIP